MTTELKAEQANAGPRQAVEPVVPPLEPETAAVSGSGQASAFTRLRNFFTSRNGITTILYSFSFFALGCCLSALGPALLSLSYQIEAPLKETSFAFTVRSVGYAFGSLLTGPLFDRFPGHITLGASLVAAGVGTVLVPSAHNVGSLCAITAFQGFGMGATDTGANVMIVWIWEDKVGPYMQSLHFAFAIGAALGPLFLRAFYKPIPGNDVTGNYSSAFYFIGALNIVVGASLWLVKSPKPRLGTAVGTLESAVGEIAAAEVTGVDTKEQKTLPAEERVEVIDLGPIPKTPVSASAGPLKPPALDQAAYDAYHKRRSRVIILQTAIVFFLLFLYVGAETGYGGFVTSYAVLALALPEATGQLLASVFWWSITVGRFSAIFISIVMAADRFLSLSMIGSFVFILMLSIGTGIYKSLGVLWAGTVLFGLFMASVFPTAIALAETYWPLRGVHTMMFVVGGAVGEVVIPLIISRFLGDPYADPSTQTGSQPDVLMWANLAACGLNLFVLGAFLYFGQGMKRDEKLFREKLEGMAAQRDEEVVLEGSQGQQ